MDFGIWAFGFGIWILGLGVWYWVIGMWDLGGNLEFGIWNLGSNAGRWEATRANGKTCVPRIGLGIFEVDAGIIYCGTPRIVDCEKLTRREYSMTRLTSVAILAQNVFS